MANVTTTLFLFILVALSSCAPLALAIRRSQKWPDGGQTRFYKFTVQNTRVEKLCHSREIVTINGLFPGPVVYAQEDDRVIVQVTNETPYNTTIHWHGVRQRLSCWSDGPAYVTQCPIQQGQTFTYEFTIIQQRGTLFWHAHVSWLRAWLTGAIVIYPKTGVPYPFPFPYEEHILIFNEWYNHDVVQLEKQMLETGGAPPPADAYLINGHPGPRYNCSKQDVYEINVVPGKTYLLRLINAGLNNQNFFTIAGHKMTVVQADGDYTKPHTIDHLMIGPGETYDVLVVANQPAATYEMALGPYISGQNITFQNISAIAYFRYPGAIEHSFGSLQFARLPAFNNNFIVATNLAGLRSLHATNLPLEIDTHLFFTVGLNDDKCNRKNPNSTCQGPNGGIFAASVNNVSFVRPKVSILQSYYYSSSTGSTGSSGGAGDSLSEGIKKPYTNDFPGIPLKEYDFVYGAPNNSPNNTGAVKGTKAYVLEYGSRVQVILQDTGTITTENHPIHLHGYSFHVVGTGSGDYNPDAAVLNLVDPPQLNTISVPVGGWAAIRFIADNPGVWFLHCHIENHLSWGLSMVFIVKNGVGPLETLPHPPADLPKC